MASKAASTSAACTASDACLIGRRQFFRIGAIAAAIALYEGARWPTLLASLMATDAANDLAVIQDHIDHPWPTMTGCFDHRGWLMYATACLWRNVNTTDANNKLAGVRITHLDGQFCNGKTSPLESNLWLAYLCRPYGLFRTGGSISGRMTAAAQTNLLEQMWLYCRPYSKMSQTTDVWALHDSENHDAQEKGCKFLAAQWFKNRSDFAGRVYADGSTPAQQYAAWRTYFSRWFDERAKRGLWVESHAPSYHGYLLQAIFNIFNFAEDPVLRKKAEMILDLDFADWALQQVGGADGSAKSRSYPDESYDPSADAMTYFGKLMNGQLPVYGNHIMFMATANYRPPALIRELATDRVGKGSYEFLSRRPGVGPLGKDANWNDHPDPARSIVNTTWVTPDYVLGSYSLNPADTHTGESGQNRWQGVQFATATAARVYPQAAPTKATDRTVDGFYSVQYRNVLLTRKSTNAQCLCTGQATVVYFPSVLDQLNEESGWLFVQEGSAYLAVRPVSGAYSWFTAAKNKATDRNNRFIRLATSTSPMIFETGRAADFASFAAFKTDIKNNPWTFASGALNYTGCDGNHLTLYTGATTPRVNGTPISWAPANTFSSPFMGSTWASGEILVFRYGGDSVNYDFTNPNNPVKTLA